MKYDKQDLPKKFIRDGRAPIPLKESTSWIMSANRGKNTTPEIIFRKALWKNNLRGYRLHLKQIPGRPDITFPKRKIAIFVNGCFWHRCPNCSLSLPKTHTTFWNEKFKKNQERDQAKIRLLENIDWTVLVFWECQIKKDIQHCVDEVEYLLTKKQS